MKAVLPLLGSFTSSLDQIDISIAFTCVFDFLLMTTLRFYLIIYLNKLMSFVFSDIFLCISHLKGFNCSFILRAANDEADSLAKASLASYLVNF